MSHRESRGLSWNRSRITATNPSSADEGFVEDTAQRLKAYRFAVCLVLTLFLRGDFIAQCHYAVVEMNILYNGIGESH